MWTFVYASEVFEPQGEILNVQDRRINLPLNKIDTCSFKVLSSNRFAENLLSCEGYIKGYRNGVLQFHGPIVTAEEVAEGGRTTISVNAMGQGWVLGKHYPTKNIATLTQDRALRFVELMGAESTKSMDNPYDPGAFGGVTGSSNMNIDVYSVSAASTAIYSITEDYSKSLATILGELSAGAGGFDWRFLARENIIDGEVDMNGAIDSFFHGYGFQSYVNSFYAAPTIGELRSEAFFEYGVGKRNITSYRRVNTREGQATVVYHRAQPGITPPTVTGRDYDSIRKWGWLEDIAEADIDDATLRQSLVDDHIAVRKQPRRRIDFTPVGSFNSSRVPQFGVDFDIGDIVRARALNSFDAMFRVWGVTFDIDSNGTEKMTLALSEEDV